MMKQTSINNSDSELATQNELNDSNHQIRIVVSEPLDAPEQQSGNATGSPKAQLTRESLEQSASRSGGGLKNYETGGNDLQSANPSSIDERAEYNVESQEAGKFTLQEEAGSLRKDSEALSSTIEAQGQQ